MKALVLLAALAASPAHADLYRWIDRETGSVKFSTTPPPWYGDPERERGMPAVEVVPYRARGAAPKPSPEVEGAAAARRAIAALEDRWTDLLKFFISLPPGTDFTRAGVGIRQQIEAFVALSTELDRLDPAGTPRRRAQEAGVVENVRKALQAQLAEKPPAKPGALPPPGERPQ